MATYTAQSVAITGTTPTYTAVSSSDTFPYNGDNQFLIVKNAGGSSVNVTIVVPGNDKHGQAVPDVVVAVPASGERWIGTFDRSIRDSTGKVTVNYSATTSVTAALVSV